MSKVIPASVPSNQIKSLSPWLSSIYPAVPGTLKSTWPPPWLYISPNSNISADDETSTAEPVSSDTLNSWLPVVILLCSNPDISAAILALSAFDEPLIVAASNDLIRVALAPNDPEMPTAVKDLINVALAPNDPLIPAPVKDLIKVALAPNDPDISVLFAFKAMSVATDALKLAVAVFNSAVVVNVSSNEELNASLAVILVAREELVAANAPDTAVLSALVAMSVAIEALNAPVDPLISAAIWADPDTNPSFPPAVNIFDSDPVAPATQ